MYVAWEWYFVKCVPTGTHPEVPSENPVAAVACSRTVSADCDERYEIQIRNCSGSMQYYLLPTVRYSAYCLGKSDNACIHYSVCPTPTVLFLVYCFGMSKVNDYILQYFIPPTVLYWAFWLGRSNSKCLQYVLFLIIRYSVSCFDRYYSKYEYF